MDVRKVSETFLFLIFSLLDVDFLTSFLDKEKSEEH